MGFDPGPAWPRGLLLSLFLVLPVACNFAAQHAGATVVAPGANTIALPTTTFNSAAATIESPSAVSSPNDASTLSAVSSQTTLPTVFVNASGEVSLPNAKMQYYDITGSTEGDLRAELNANGPVGYDGYKSDATTRWFIGWAWPGYGTSFCVLSAPTVWYQITVIFPRWKAPANTSSPLMSKWRNFEQALGAHEEGHVDFVVTHYTSVSTAIERASCTTADAAAQDALKPIRQHDIDYDAQTNHGATQGARFP